MGKGAGSPKNGTPVGPTVITAPVAGGAEGEFEFENSVRPCLISNATGDSIYIKINDSTYSATSLTDHHVGIANATQLDVSYGGQLNIKFLTIYVPSGTVANLEINGWRAGD